MNKRVLDLLNEFCMGEYGERLEDEDIRTLVKESEDNV